MKGLLAPLDSMVLRRLATADSRGTCDTLRWVLNPTRKFRRVAVVVSFGIPVRPRLLPRFGDR